MSFKRAVYGSAHIKKALCREQHGKCCYCESKFEYVYSGDVEHYRPKGAANIGTTKIWPGYYWLAYDWSNLFFSCAACNQHYKRDQFPLVVEARRCRDHYGDVEAEEPLILKPSGPQDPRNHIIFRCDLPVGVTEAGKETIRVVGLDREELSLKRFAHLKMVKHLYDAARLLYSDPTPEVVLVLNGIRSALTALKSPTAEFSAAVQDFLISQRPFDNLLNG